MIREPSDTTPRNDDAPLPPALAAHVDAARGRDAGTAQADAAQARLQRTLAARTTPRRAALPRFAVAFASCCVVAVLALALFAGDQWLGGQHGAAFAAVQQRLRDFATLRVVIEQRHGGERLSRTVLQLDRSGSLRTDVDDQVSVIVDMQRASILTLLHAPRLALLQPLPPGGRPDEALDWLAAIRDFQGQAQPLPPRDIDGQQLSGWRLTTHGQRIDLWADADGIPRRMELGATADLVLDYHFDYDAPIAADQLSAVIPPGYTEGTPDAD